ncbi:hypothetical protein CDL12_13420 [Handroanthus impetiginosus]|uniref:Putative plant transposon protein domain-containing protein n=1 Tax=Handroanthus impetiginosus TaxID=429701 RepID=A0A2G9H8U6_9LAMI|nr:hypothetical protein CDL12_13420 [Handroanthus impetiginosus]
MSGRCPAKRKQTNEASTSKEVDQRRFISQEAENYYNERLINRAMVRERDHPSLDTICELICQDDPQWTLIRLNVPIHLSRTKLAFAADNWLRFVSAQLLPSSHTSEVTRERAVMIFAILTDVPFDIGRFLHRSIWKSAMGSLTVGLYHPSLITELCAFQPRQRQPLQAGLEERVDRFADEVHHLQLQQEQQFAYQQQCPLSNCLRYPPDELAEPPLADMGDE